MNNVSVMEARDPIQYINGPLLRKQRQFISDLIADNLVTDHSEYIEVLEGISHLLDNIADYATDHYGIKGCLLTEENQSAKRTTRTQGNVFSSSRRSQHAALGM